MCFFPGRMPGQSKVASLGRLPSIYGSQLPLGYTGRPLAIYAALRSLKEVNLYHTTVTEQGYARLKEARPGCRIVWDRDSSLPNRRRS